MKILAFALLWEIGMGLALLGYIWIEWKFSKKKIVDNGWNLNRCTPFEPWWAPFIFFVPVLRVGWYLTTGELIEQLARIKKSENYTIVVGYGKMQIFYED